MLLRVAEPADALAVARLHVRSWQVAYRGLVPDDYLDGLDPEVRAARYTFSERDPGHPETMLAVDDDAVCGFATVGAAGDADAAGRGEIQALYVDPDRWSQGIGRLLIADARDRLAGLGHRDAVLWVLVGNEQAARFYAADGWEPDGARRVNGQRGVPTEEIRYARRLD